MLIGNTEKRPNLETIRRIKRALRDALDLPEEATITLTELACLEKDCAPVETVFGLLHPGAPQLQHKVHKAVDAVDADDLMLACRAWGYEVNESAFLSFTREV